jgi:hypothetical protein
MTFRPALVEEVLACGEGAALWACVELVAGFCGHAANAANKAATAKTGRVLRVLRFMRSI